MLDDTDLSPLSDAYHYCRFYDIDYDDCQITRGYQTAHYENKVKTTRSRYGDTHNTSGRYRVLNFQNANTVEVRIFRGTLSYVSFIAALQLCKIFLQISMEKLTEKQIRSITWRDVCKKSASHREFIEYLKKQNLYEA
jgi:hypothetical protein